MNDKNKLLLDIAHQINYEYYNLQYYSSEEMENTKFFDDAINNVRRLIILEDKIVSKLEIDELKEMMDNLPEIDGDDYARTYDILVDKYYDKIYESNDMELICEEIDFYGELTFLPDSLELEMLDIDGYRYHDIVLAYIYILAMKREEQLLKEITSYNQVEDSLKNIYYKDFKYHKYNIFQELSPYFEKMAVAVSFDPLKFPDMKNLDIDLSSIYYNECFVIINKICQLIAVNDIEDSIPVLLFYVLCFEELINYLNMDQLVYINNFINEMDEIFKDSLPINACLKRIRKKTD